MDEIEKLKQEIATKEYELEQATAEAQRQVESAKDLQSELTELRNQLTAAETQVRADAEWQEAFMRQHGLA
jgi:predicted  nucleic acid-binding Zn-ribbon protein